jgi:hypothetical protein
MTLYINNNCKSDRHAEQPTKIGYESARHTNLNRLLQLRTPPFVESFASRSTGATAATTDHQLNHSHIFSRASKESLTEQQQFSGEKQQQQQQQQQSPRN